jgi:putative endonuclease
MRLRRLLDDWLSRFSDESRLGRRGERAAARYLRRLGYRVLARGERLGLGELDLIAVDRDRSVVFIEVKTRRSQETGHPSEAVDPGKRRRLTRLAVAFLKRHGLLEHKARFDVVAVTWPADRRRPTIEHLQNAFEAVGKDEFYS